MPSRGADSPCTKRSEVEAKPYEPNALLRWLYRRFFTHIQVDERWSGAVREAAERGTVVYVMRSISFLDFLCLDFLVKRFRLPLVRFANDLGLWILEPFGKGRRRLSFRNQVPEDEALSETVREGHSALLFLRRPPKFAKAAHRGEQLDVDLIRVLIAMQREQPRPILLVPQTFVWNKLPPNKRRTLLDLVFGPAEWPGRIRVLFQFLRNYRNALLQTGEAFDLKHFLETNPELSNERAADKVRYAMLRRMERERVVVLGPSMKTPQRIREEILRSPRVAKHIDATARASGRDRAAVLRRADRDLRKLCAAPNATALAITHRVLDSVWNRLYDGLVVDQEGIERVREASRNGTLVLLPSHKSHVDYIVLSDVFYANALSCPVIAAGDNLSFWPLGPWFRRTGAFFIRRTLRGDKLYSALLDAYVRKLIAEGFSVELFLEGGRSRTGKLLPPQVGLLAMLIDAALALRGKPVFFVPISIAYERIIEERSYVHELGGGEKEKEDLSGLLKAPRVFRSQYGRLYLEIGDIFSLADCIAEVTEPRGADTGTARGPDTELSPKERRAVIQTVAQHATREINRVTVVTPASLVATALLSHPRRGMAHSELLETSKNLLESAQRFEARVTRPVTETDGSLSRVAVEEAINLFTDAKLVVKHVEGEEAIYRVPDERRIALEYYKNNVLHFFAPSALMATSLLADGAEPVEAGELAARYDALVELFRHELLLGTQRQRSTDFDRTLENMLDAGEVELRDGLVRPGPGRAGARLSLHARLIRGYFDSYRLALRGIGLLDGGAMSLKEWTRRTLVLGHRMYLSGELEMREALSRIKLESALRTLHDQGVVKLTGSEVKLKEGHADPEQLRELDRRIQRYLG